MTVRDISFGMGNRNDRAVINRAWTGFCQTIRSRLNRLNIAIIDCKYKIIGFTIVRKCGIGFCRVCTMSWSAWTGLCLHTVQTKNTEQHHESGCFVFDVRVVVLMQKFHRCSLKSQTFTECILNELSHKTTAFQVCKIRVPVNGYLYG